MRIAPLLHDDLTGTNSVFWIGATHSLKEEKVAAIQVIVNIGAISARHMTPERRAWGSCQPMLKKVTSVFTQSEEGDLSVHSEFAESAASSSHRTAPA